MNEIVNTFLLAGDKFMPEMHLRQSRFTYIACGSFTKNKEKNKKKLKKEEIQNELNKACFSHSMAYGDFKDLNKRTFADKVLHS